MFNYANDIDIYREWAQIVVHNKFTAEYFQISLLLYRRKFQAQFSYSHEQILATMEIKLFTTGDHLRQPELWHLVRSQRWKNLQNGRICQLCLIDE
jgi:hypothetical protein